MNKLSYVYPQFSMILTDCQSLAISQHKLFHVRAFCCIDIDQRFAVVANVNRMIMYHNVSDAYKTQKYHHEYDASSDTRLLLDLCQFHDHE